MIDGGKEVRLADGHAQHRHLQPREPHAHAGVDALFGQDALEQQRNDLDRRPLLGRGRRLLQRLLALMQFLKQHRRGHRRLAARRRCRGLDAALNALLRLVDRRGQPRRQRRVRALRVGKGRQMPADQPVQPHQHGFGVFATARQRRGARHQPRFLADVAQGGLAPAAVRATVRPRPGTAHASAASARRRRVGFAARAGSAKARGSAAVQGVGLRRHAARTLDVRMQIDRGQHTTLDQPAVGLVVGLLDQRRQFLVQIRLQLAPTVQAAAGRAPGVDDDARQHVRAQHVLGVELLASFQRRHARTQVGEFRGRQIHHRQRQARGQDLAFDGVVVDQRQRTAGAGRRQVGRTLRRCALQQRAAQAAHHRLVPGCGALLQLEHQIAAAHESRMLAGLVEQMAGDGGERIDQRRQPLDQMLGVDAPRLFGGAGVICALSHV